MKIFVLLFLISFTSAVFAQEERKSLISCGPSFFQGQPLVELNGKLIHLDKYYLYYKNIKKIEVINDAGIAKKLYPDTLSNGILIIKSKKRMKLIAISEFSFRDTTEFVVDEKSIGDAKGFYIDGQGIEKIELKGVNWHTGALMGKITVLITTKKMTKSAKQQAH